MKRRAVEPDEGLAPPPRLLRCMPSEYEATAYTSELLTRWLEDRAAWRAGSAVPLPPPPSRERAALWVVEVPAHLLAADRDAPRPGHWDDRTDPHTR